MKNIFISSLFDGIPYYNAELVLREHDFLKLY